MYEVKQHHFDEVLNGYSKIEEDYKAQQSEFSSDSARVSKNLVLNLVLFLSSYKSSTIHTNFYAI